MAGPGICVLCLADTCASEVNPVLNLVAPHGYLLPNMYLFIADISNSDFLYVVVGPVFLLTSPAFMRSSASQPAGPHGRLAPKNGKSGHHCWGPEVSTSFAQQFVSAGTAPPLVGCVVWSHIYFIMSSSIYSIIYSIIYYTVIYFLLSGNLYICCSHQISLWVKRLFSVRWAAQHPKEVRHLVLPVRVYMYILTRTLLFPYIWLTE